MTGEYLLRSLDEVAAAVALEAAVVRRYAEIGLIRPAPPGYGPADLAELLEDERSWVREESLRALGALRAKQVVPAIEARLRDAEEREYVRSAAAVALGRIGDPRAVHALSEVARAPNTPSELKGEVAQAPARGES